MMNTRMKHAPMGFSLVEMLIAVSVIVLLTATVVVYVRLPRAKATYHTCELNRSQLQLRVDEYRRLNGRYPSANLRELVNRTFALPVCPVDGLPYRLNAASGTISSHGHAVP